MELNSFELPVFGQIMRFKSDKDMSYLQVLIEKFNQKLEEIQKVSPTVEPIKMLVLLSLNLLDEFETLQKKQEGEKKLIEEKVLEIMSKISQNMGDGDV